MLASKKWHEVMIIDRLKSLLNIFFLRSSLGRSILVLGGSTAIGQVIVVFTSPILARLYAPSDYGSVTVFSSILAILTTIVALRYEIAIPLPDSDSVAASLLILAALIVLGMSTLTGVAVFFLGDQIVAWANTPSLRPLLWLLPIGAASTGSYHVLNYWSIRKKEFPRLARTRLGQSFGQVLTQMGMGLLRQGPLGLLLGILVGQAGGCGSLAAFLLRQDRANLTSVSWGMIRSAAQRYRRFPLVSSGSALLNSAGLNVPVLLLASFYGPEVVGWFSLGRRVVKMPMTLIGQAVSDVYLAESAQLRNHNPQALPRLFLGIAVRLALLGGVPILAAGIFAPQLAVWVFGEPWREAGEYIKIMALMYAVQLVVVPLSATLTVLKRQELQLAWDASRLILSAGSLLIANELGWTAIGAITAYSGSMLVAYIALFIMSALALFRAAAREVRK